MHLESSVNSCLGGNEGAENDEKREYKYFGLAMGKYLREAYCVITDK